MIDERADLSPYPTGVAARLSAHCTFSFGRPGFLSDFSGGRSGGRGDVTANGWVVRHVRRRDKQGAGERLQGERRKGRRRMRGWENRRREKGRSPLCVSDRG